MPASNPNWEICQWIDYITGPEEEGVTQPTPYATRWGVWLDRTAGTVEYAVEGEPRQPAPLSLFPTVLTGAVAISLSFDQDAEPVFAIGFDDSHIEVRRNVAGTPTTYTFDGVTPRLLFNGILLPPNSSASDVVCYYSRDGTLYARYQRDNFGVEYQATNFPLNVVSVKKVDTNGAFELIYVKRLVDIFFTENYAIRSVVYPAPPVEAEDFGLIDSELTAGRYLYIIVDGGSYTESGSINSVLQSGQYLSIIVLVGPETDEANLDSRIQDGEYVLVIVNAGDYSDEASINSVLVDGEYSLVIIQGGSYAEESSLNSQIVSGNYYT